MTLSLLSTQSAPSKDGGRAWSCTRSGSAGWGSWMLEWICVHSWDGGAGAPGDGLVIWGQPYVGVLAGGSLVQMALRGREEALGHS